MTLVIELTPEQEARLDAAARAQGIEAAECARQLVTNHLPPLQPRQGADLDQAIVRMIHRSPEQIEEQRSRSETFITPGRPLPPGQTVYDAVFGQWPGDETNDEVLEALERLS